MITTSWLGFNLASLRSERARKGRREGRAAQANILGLHRIRRKMPNRETEKQQLTEQCLFCIWNKHLGFVHFLPVNTQRDKTSRHIGRNVVLYCTAH